MMKKQWGCYWLAYGIISLLTAAGAVLLSRVFLPLSLSALLLGRSAALYLYARFRALDYERGSDSITIRSGVFLRTEHILPLDKVLWRTAVTLGAHTLFTVLYTASGRAVVFTAVDGE